MSLDGLSFSNLGLYNVVSPIDAQSQAEKNSQNKAEEVIKKTEEIKKIDSDAEKEKNEQNANDEEDNENNDEYSQSEEIIINKTIITQQTGLKKYIVNYNKETNEVELINKNDRSLIESLSPAELMEINKKFQKDTGFLIDKEG